MIENRIARSATHRKAERRLRERDLPTFRARIKLWPAAVKTNPGNVTRLIPGSSSLSNAEPQAFESAKADADTVIQRPDLVAALTGGRTYTDEEQQELERAALQRAFDRRREILRRALSTAEVSRLLGASRQALNDRVTRGSLLAMRENGQLRFPIWQFDPTGPDGVVAGLPETLRTLNVPAFSKMVWLTRPQPGLEGRTPIEVLKHGELNRVCRLAQAVDVA